MKYVLIVMLITFGFFAAADGEPSVPSVKTLIDEDIGQVDFRLADDGHSSFKVLGVMVKCNDKRKNRRPVEPVTPGFEPIDRLKGVPVCFFTEEERRKTFIDKDKILWVNSSKVYLHSDGSFRCEDYKYDRIDLSKFCAHWRN